MPVLIEEAKNVPEAPGFQRFKWLQRFRGSSVPAAPLHSKE